MNHFSIDMLQIISGGVQKYGIGKYQSIELFHWYGLFEKFSLKTLL